MKFFTRATIQQAVDSLAVVDVIERAFRSYSNRDVQSGAVAHLNFADPPGDFHIKSAHISGAPVFVVKMAGSFYENPARALPSSNGLMMVFDAETGQPRCALLDEGYLTDLRTAIAGAIAARLIAPVNPSRLGVVGAGTQARAQAEWICRVLDIPEVQIWARNPDRSKALAAALERGELSATSQPSLEGLCRDCDLVVTATPSRTPLITKAMLRPGLRIVAVGADSFGKQEIAAEIVAAADLVLADSIDQCSDYGDCASAVASGALDRTRIQEIGSALLPDARPVLERNAIALADLTGIGALDAAIAAYAYTHLSI